MTTYLPNRVVPVRSNAVHPICAPPGMMKSPQVAGKSATSKWAGMPIETPKGISAAVVAEGLKITAEKQKSTTPKSIGAD